MSGLRERLNRLKKSEPEKTVRRTESLGAAWDRMNARLQTNESGSFIMRERVYPLDHMHGRYPLGKLSGESHVLSAFHSGREVSCDKLLFFDTETTGLGVGAGNVPFMVGIGFYTEDAFTVQQLFIRNPGEELAMLQHLKGKLDASTHLVSYNGRTFDWPILKNRYVINRLEPLEERLLQLDFLYPSRSLWKSTLPSCRLGKVEEARLSFFRQDDVPGSLAPALYFQYLAENDASLIEGVFVHNEYDILSLAGLAIHFVLLLQGEASFSDMHPDEIYRTGAWLERMGRKEQAEEAFRYLMDHSSSYKAGAYQLLLAQHYKKNTDYERAVALWSEYIHEKHAAPSAVLEPYIELSMFYEHRAKDFRSALQYARWALDKLWKRQSLSRSAKGMKNKQAVQELDKRIERIKRKLAAGSETSQKRAAAASGSRAARRKETRYEGVYMDSLFKETGY